MDDDDVKTKTQEENAISQLMSLESTIHRYLLDIEKFKEQLKTQSDMYKSAFENDAAFSQEEEKVKEINRKKKEVQQKIAKQPSVVTASSEMKRIKEDIKDAQEALSDYVLQYQRASNSDHVTAPDGELLRIVHTAKLVKEKK